MFPQYVGHECKKLQVIFWASGIFSPNQKKIPQPQKSEIALWKDKQRFKNVRRHRGSTYYDVAPRICRPSFANLALTPTHILISIRQGNMSEECAVQCGRIEDRCSLMLGLCLSFHQTKQLQIVGRKNACVFVCVCACLRVYRATVQMCSSLHRVGPARPPLSQIGMRGPLASLIRLNASIQTQTSDGSKVQVSSLY